MRNWRPELWLVPLLVVAACRDHSPKPHSFPRVYYPERAYTEVEPDCPFTLEIPVYSKLRPAAEDCWYDLDFPEFNATLHLSYKPMRGSRSLDSMMEDAYRLAFKHIGMAEDIVPREFTDSSGNLGMIYDLYGKTATPFNFFLSDRESHFIRGSFYFNAHTDKDSVAPIYDFLKKDIMHVMRSVRWK